YFLTKGKSPDVFRSQEDAIKIDPEMFLHINKNPLPRVYTLDKVIIAQDEEQLSNLVELDLRRAVYADFNPNIKYDNKIEDDYLAHFANLQGLNVIKEPDFSNPNRVTLKADITIPSMMVFTEVWYPGWKARVDGRPQEIYRVNYCQRGIWLDEGQHEVDIFFLPSIWKKGKAVSVASLVLAVLLFTANLLYCKKLQTAGR
ncbi:MAG: hypothetical protein PHQ54_01880, partial [Candidatus Omnitrophica bacterium]|nr:hypothetical protein [Candidatus Omnitrophota bacterium]